MLMANPWKYATIALLPAILGLYFFVFGFPLIGGGLLKDLSAARTQIVWEKASHRRTKENFRLAMAQAVRMEADRIARVNLETKWNNERAKENTARRLAGLRDTYERLLRQNRASASGSSGGLDLSSVSFAASGTDAATQEDGFFVSTGPDFSLAERYECSIYATNFDELISWVDRQTAVKVN